MANGLTTDWSKLSKELEELAKKKDKGEPKISLGQGPTFPTTGTQTISQPIAKFYSEVDTRKLTPFEISQMGGEEEIAKRKESAKKLIASETPSTETLSITGEKKAEVKSAPKSATKAKDEKPKPDLYRVMVKGGKSSEDEFYDTKEAADAALKKMGGKGAVAGIRFPAKSREEESALKEQYMQQARIGKKTATLPKANETEKESIMRQVREANPQATTAQQENYYKTLTASRARGRERGGYAEEYQAAVAKGKTPSPYEERLMEEEARNRRMSDFLTKSAAKGLAERAEKSYSDEYKYLKSFERAAKKAGAFGSALEARKRLEGLSSQFGSGASSSSNRMKYFERQAMDEVKRQIDARDRMRRQLLQKQTISNPEASSSLAYTVDI